MKDEELKEDLIDKLGIALRMVRRAVVNGGIKMLFYGGLKMLFFGGNKCLLLADRFFI
ncbi:TPA: hypothetical protein ACGWAD_002288 [Enterococcus faecium]